MPDDIEPYILYRPVEGDAEFALWELEKGGTALALFLTDESAASYRSAAGLGSEWQIMQPTPPSLLDVLRSCHEAGIQFAVLDPSASEARRIFQIASMLKDSGEE